MARIIQSLYSVNNLPTPLYAKCCYSIMMTDVRRESNITHGKVTCDCHSSLSILGFHIKPGTVIVVLLSVTIRFVQETCILAWICVLITKRSLNESLSRIP